ncbi:MAG: Xaa-Pro peptidase family protein [Candidatus Omnitrophica bacterium]|nr:Xaa-Pro peptidase family protein [Candidatus Omnitrophota bacterium]
MNTRIAQLNSLIKKKNLEAFLVSRPVNIEYLSGFPGEDALLLIIPGRINLIITDSRFVQEVSQIRDFKPEITREKIPHYLSRKFRSLNLRRVGFESNGLTYEQHRLLTEACKDTKWVPLSNLIEEMRLLKEEVEIEKIRRAIEVAQLAFETLLTRLKPGAQEREIAHLLEYLIYKKGGDGPAFPIIVASGENASRPHAQPGGKKWETTEPLLIDWGAKLEGYNCDLTRVVFSYRINSTLREIYKILLEAEERAISLIKPGREAREIDQAVREHLKKYGKDKYFLHSTGHGIGKEVHESPWIAQRSRIILKENMVFTIEPGIYVKGNYGMRVEDVVRVTSQGYEVLSHKLRKIYFKK